MENLLEITDRINRHVWMYWGGPRREDALIISNPLVAFPRLQANLDLLRKYPSPGDLKESCLREIREICYGEELPADIVKNTTLESELTQDIISKEVKKGLDILQTSTSPEIADLEKKFSRRWLYFEGEEEGSVIIWITKISYLANIPVWSGLLIELMTEGSSVGIGVAVREVDEEGFCELPGYDFGIETSARDLQRWLKENGEELDWREVKKKIHDQISYGFREYNDSVTEENEVPEVWS